MNDKVISIFKVYFISAPFINGIHLERQNNLTNSIGRYYCYKNLQLINCFWKEVLFTNVSVNKFFAP